MSDNSIKIITARHIGGGRVRILSLRTDTRRIDYMNSMISVKPEQNKVVDFNDALERIVKWQLSVGPDDVTYHGVFKNSAAYGAWCADLLCDDHNVKWDVTVEYTSGSIAAYICTSELPFPLVFDDLCQEAELTRGGAA